MRLHLEFLPLTFSALLPVINPIGSSLLFLEIAGTTDPQIIRKLARQVAVSTVLFLLIIDIAGAAILTFFGISLPVVQFTGGFVLAAMGWGLLNQKETDRDKEVSSSPADRSTLGEMVFYPFTFPLTAGPGCIVVMLTLSAHASQKHLIDELWNHGSIFGGIVLIGITVWLSYAYAITITKKISPQTIRGIFRVIAFILLCIGVQIAWRGLEGLIHGKG